MSFDHHRLLARDLEPSVELRIGPGVDDIVDLSRAKIEDEGEDLRAQLLSMPPVHDGANWQTLATYTGGNGTAAKVAIALGHHLGLWKMHPPPRAPELWTSIAYPTVLAGTVVQPLYEPGSGVPKPSRGDMERHQVPCQKCRRPMGPWDSRVHSLLAAGPGSAICIECELGIDPEA